MAVSISAVVKTSRIRMQTNFVLLCTDIGKANRAHEPGRIRLGFQLGIYLSFLRLHVECWMDIDQRSWRRTAFGEWRRCCYGWSFRLSFGRTQFHNITSAADRSWREGHGGSNDAKKPKKSNFVHCCKCFDTKIQANEDRERFRRLNVSYVKQKEDNRPINSVETKPLGDTRHSNTLPVVEGDLSKSQNLTVAQNIHCFVISTT